MTTPGWRRTRRPRMHSAARMTPGISQQSSPICAPRPTNTCACRCDALADDRAVLDHAQRADGGGGGHLGSPRDVGRRMNARRRLGPERLLDAGAEARQRDRGIVDQQEELIGLRLPIVVQREQHGRGAGGGDFAPVFGIAQKRQVARTAVPSAAMPRTVSVVLPRTCLGCVMARSSAEVKETCMTQRGNFRRSVQCLKKKPPVPGGTGGVAKIRRGQRLRLLHTRQGNVGRVGTGARGGAGGGRGAGGRRGRGGAGGPC